MRDNPYVYIQELARYCTDHNLTIALAESCSGGLVSAWITAVPGVSSWFKGSACVYSNEAKIKILDVPKTTLALEGAVSEPVALAMAMGAQRCYDVDVTGAITGIAGPHAVDTAKPIGTVCFGFYDHRRKKGVTKTAFFTGGRAHVREQASMFALQALIEFVALE